MRKKKQKILTLVGCFCLLMTGGIFSRSNLTSHADSSLDLQTVYCLTLTDYEVQNYTTKVKAIDPNGDEVLLHRGILSLDIAGTYTIDYGNGDVKYIVSLLNGAVEDLTFTTTMEQNVSTGKVLTLPMPTFVKVDGYEKRAAKYRIEISQNGELVGNVERKEGEVATYFFTTAGNYVVTYFSIDEFGLERQDESFTLNVEDKEDVFFEDLPDQVNYGEEVDIGFPYGFYKGVMYEARVNIKTPLGENLEWKAPKYQFLQTGDYVFTYMSKVNGKEIVNTQTVQVSDRDTAFTFINGAGLIEYDETLPSNVDRYYGEHTKLSNDKTAVKITSNDTSPKILYNQVIDLSKISPEENLISFFPVSAEDKDLGGVWIRLTDIYDSSKSVAIYIRKNPNEVKYSTAFVEFNGVSASIANDPKASVYGTVRTDANAAFIYYQSSLIPCHYEDMRMFTVRFNYAENAVYAFSRNNNYQFVNQLMLDMDDPTKISYDNLFEGFTTGEVALTIELDRNMGAGVYIAEIAGKKVSQEKDDSKSKVLINLSTTQEEVYDGAVGYHYALPSASVLPYVQSSESIHLSLYKNGQDCSSLLDGYTFVPTESGVYEARYRYAYRGETLENRLAITVNDNPNPISVEIPTDETAEYGSLYYIPNLIYSGGNGAKSLIYKVTLNGKEILPTEKGGYAVTEGGKMEVFVTITDQIGFKKSFSYEVLVQDGVVLSLESAVPTSVRIGQEVKFPNFTAKSVSGTTVLEEKNTRILVNGSTELTNDFTYIVPNLSLIKVEYQVDTGEGFVTWETYEIPVYASNVATMKELFIVSDTVGTQLLENNLLFGMEASDTPYEIAVPNVLSTYNLAITFVINENTFNADAFTIFYSDTKNGNTLKVHFFEINTAKKQAKFTINGNNQIFVLKGTQNVYTENCGNATVAARYAGTSYIMFSLELNESGEYFTDGTTQEVVARFSSFDNGSAFTGFTYNVCNVRTQVEGVNAYTEVGIANISNQQFNYLIENFGYEDFDNKGPQINVYGDRELVEMQLLDTYTVGAAKGYDVIQGVTDVRVNVTSESGKKLVNNRSASSGYSITLEEMGYYTVEYVSYDRIGNKSTVSFKIVVADTIAPTLTVNGSYKSTYNLGDKVKIFDFTANDADGETVGYIYLQTPNGLSQVNANEEISVLVKGKYTVVYWAEDEWKNITRAVYEFEVI